MPAKEFYQRHKEQCRQESNKYYGDNRDKVLSKQKIYRQNNKPKLNERQKKYIAKYGEEVLHAFGDTCVLCHTKLTIDNYQAHEIHGKPHPYLSSKARRDYLFQHKEDFRLLDYDCHKGSHWLMEKFDYTWEMIVKLFEQTI